MKNTEIRRKRRVFLMVLDSVGAGALPDAADWGDEGCGTLRSVSRSDRLHLDTLLDLGLSHITDLSFLGGRGRTPRAAYARMSEISQGKDTTIGHWELAGVLSERPLPTYPDGFPQELLDRLTAYTGRRCLCNRPYSGTEVIKDYGEEHMRTGALIVYTSADSVMQIAAHNDIVPLEQLYDYCAFARGMMTGEHGVGRIIARPFAGESGSFRRTADRRDYSIEPPSVTLLDCVSEAGLDVLSVGKIKDIFCGRGITRSYPAHNNAESMAACDEAVETDFNGLCFINLVDFDMLYGHRQDIDGYAQALTDFDIWLKGFLPRLREDDVLMITADHGCDPGDSSTDHTREYVPLLVYGNGIPCASLGTLRGFCSAAASAAEWLGIEYRAEGESFLNRLYDE